MAQHRILMHRQYLLRSRHSQQGAVLIMTAAFMLLAVLCLALVVDTGRLYVEKRKLQRVADMAAIEAMSRDGACNTGTALTFATQSAARNDFVVGGDFHSWVLFSDKCFECRTLVGPFGPFALNIVCFGC